MASAKRALRGGALVAILATVGACSSSENDNTADASPDAPPDASLDSSLDSPFEAACACAVDDATISASLSCVCPSTTWNFCNDTLAGTVADTCANARQFVTIRQDTYPACGLVVLHRDHGSMASEDFAFDATTGTIVGFTSQSDTPWACPVSGDGSPEGFVIAVGRLPDATCGTPASDDPCGRDGCSD